jgi:uncharacterized protein (DUF3820 family)
MAGNDPQQRTEPDTTMLVEVARMRMPFEPYVVWFHKRGFPRGRLGELLATVYEIKANGLEPLLASLREPTDPRYRPGDPRHFREGDR